MKGTGSPDEYFWKVCKIKSEPGVHAKMVLKYLVCLVEGKK
jgi:hypothetical protein